MKYWRSGWAINEELAGRVSIGSASRPPRRFPAQDPSPSPARALLGSRENRKNVDIVVVFCCEAIVFRGRGFALRCGGRDRGGKRCASETLRRWFRGATQRRRGGLRFSPYPWSFFSSFARCASRPESGYLLPVTQNAAVVVGFSGRHVGLGRLFVPVRAAGHIGAANGTFSIFSDLNGAPGEA